MPADLLFEIGCEEVPAKKLADQLVELPKLVEDRLAKARLAHSGIRAVGTPRRLAVIVKGLIDRQPDINEEVVGPPVSAAFAADGSVTKAGQGFAAKNGVDPATLQKKEVAGKKGQYAVAVRNVIGDDTRKILPALLTDVANAIQWPKSQRWGWSETTFVRPVQWLVALFGGEVVPVGFADLTATRNSRGHRFLAPGPVEIRSPDKYLEALRAAHVIADPDARRTAVQGELANLEKETGCKVREDQALLDEVIHLGEYPVGVSGHFDPAYLEVPEELIVLAMRTHQRYFAMEDATGKLTNRFATMMATVVKDKTVVAKGNEKVLAARLSDARFFFTEDRKKSFDQWNEKNESVVFQAKLGSIGQKTRRIEAIASKIAAHLELTSTNHVREAANNCKADLRSLAVNEFPELEGLMGRYYAKHFGLDPEVATAIEEHRWPKGQGAALPSTEVGAVLAIADRMDTVVGVFAVGEEPKGGNDPLAVRRAAIGIWQILLARGGGKWAGVWNVAFEAARESLAYAGVNLRSDGPVREFFLQRLRGILIDQGIPAADADAALAQRFDDPVDALARARALGRVPKPAREVFKRVANILDDAKQKEIKPAASIDPSLFAKDRTVEQDLHAAVTAAVAREAEPRKQRDYAAVFDSLVQLQPTVAAFFDKGGVMVMDPDEKLRANRLALLQWLITPYLQIADFRLATT
jgi:glycyl-tRNA synthetase beta chain